MPPVAILAFVLTALALASAGRAADPVTVEQKAALCAPCHGPDGNSTNPLVPSLAGQPPLYTYYQLILFKLGRRQDPQMSPFAAMLSDAQMQDLAAYFAARPPRSFGGPVDAAKAAAGAKVSAAHHCGSCHTPTFGGQNHIPRLTGLSYEYLVKHLTAFRAQTRAETDLHMTMAAQALTEDDIEKLAHFLVDFGVRSLPGDGRASPR
jgi:cytochrome c553